MPNNSEPFKLSDGEAGGLVVPQRALRLWWYGLPAWARSPVWPALLATLTILGLLLSFHQVVHQAVQQSELRLQAYNASAVRPSNAQAVLVTSLELLSDK
jgi:hypothetical protein